MKTIPLIKTLLAAALLLSASAAYAQDSQPTLADTIAFITDKLNNPPGVVFYTEKDIKREIYAMKVDWFNGGILCVHASERRTVAGSQPEGRITRYQMPLGTLSSDVTVIPSPSIEENSPVAYGVVIASAPPAPGAAQSPGSIVVQEGNTDAQTEKKITLWFKSEDTAKRIAEAFHHAIALSGGKKELFGN
jgi:hypothetical protein